MCQPIPLHSDRSPKVSVVIPSYNHGRFLRRRVDSILNQTYSDFEIILLDDASTDNTAAVLKEYAGHPLIRLASRPTNSGSVFVQWNTGIGMARGEYVWIAESDDYADVRFLQELVPVLDRNPQVGLVKCKSSFIDENDQPLPGATEAPSRDWSQDFTIEGREDCRLQLTHGTSIANASAVLFRRRVYLDAGWADASYRMCADWLQWAKMMLRADFTYVAQPLNFYRCHRNTVRQECLNNVIRDLEELRVCAYLLSRVSVPDRTVSDLCDRIVLRWTSHSLRRSRIHGSLAYDLRILRILRQIDRQYASRIVRHTVRTILARIRQRTRCTQSPVTWPDTRKLTGRS
ncbi:MAG TPA: glycosyltransferase [Sedimentisphaerales bacterium]|nr:glycosyltransferase [Sedimentisphaerales bacterium]